MTIYDPFAYRPVSTPEEHAQRLVSEVSGRLSAAERANAFAALSAQSPWIDVDLDNDFWVNAGNAPPRYYIDPVGRVYFSGYVTTPLAVWTLPVDIFTLEPGYIPPYDYSFITHYAFDGEYFGGVILVQANGLVTLTDTGSTPAAPLGTSFSLNSVSFRAIVPGDV